VICVLRLVLRGASNAEGQVLTLTAVVKASTGTAIPSGSVTFSEDGVPLGTVVLDATGAATIATPPQATGTHSISATYAASPVFSNSGNTVSFTVPVPDFALALDKTSLTLTAGASGTVNVTLTPASGFADVVSLTVNFQ
jgi:Bacterial Ig-like domain (group 3)